MTWTKVRLESQFLSFLINPEDKHHGHPLAVVKVLNHLHLHSPNMTQDVVIKSAFFET